MMARVSLIAANNINVERHAYCLCLHVRPATIFVAVINLAGSLICALLTFFFMVSNDHQGMHSYFASRFVRDETVRINLISVLMYLLLAWVSAMLLYGVIKSKPRYILPFFGIQFIDYLFTLPQFFALFTNPYHYYAATAKTTKNMMEIHGVNNVGNNVLSDSKLSTSDFDDMPNTTTVWASTYQRNFQVYTTTLLVMTFFMIFKTYFLCVVWKCYRYLHMKEFILPIALSSAANGINGGQLDHDLPPLILNGRMAANIPPPDYDEATKLPDYKPPEYTQVVDVPLDSDKSSSSTFRTISLDSPPPSSSHSHITIEQQQQQTTSTSNQQQQESIKNNIDNV
ncbi:uncharacterized protein LOC113795599 [Dermatophagoides pteronyssinus]|uniref:uncharacterized protein LOC113795599 n=1 Tax=Dermatophagoides pteronyssinus TaxID=6956 RepID=UPI003F677542